MKILFAYTENYVQGGGNRYMTDVLNSTHHLYDKIVVCSNKNGIFDADFRRLEFEYDYISLPLITFHQIFHKSKMVEKAYTRIPLKLLFMLFSPLFFVYNLILIFKTLNKYKISQLISFNGGYPAAPTALWIMMLSKFLGINNVLSIVSYPSKIFPMMDYFLDKIVEFSASKIIVNAKAIKDGLQQKRFFVGKNIFVVHNCLVNKQITDYSIKNSDQEIVIGYAGRMDIEKGILYLIDAFIELSDIFSNIKLVLVGKGTAVEPAKQRIAKTNLQNKINLTGFYEGDIDEVIQTFDIFAFPSFHEGFPYSILEAMRMGKAIVSSNVGGISEAIEHEKTGLLIKPFSVEDLKNSISKLIKDQNLRVFLASQARKKFLEEFQYSKMKEKLVSLLSKP